MTEQSEAYLAVLAERYGPAVREWHGKATPPRSERRPVSELDAARHRRDLLAAVDEPVHALWMACGNGAGAGAGDDAGADEVEEVPS